jgi:hypothetical protein
MAKSIVPEPQYVTLTISVTVHEAYQDWACARGFQQLNFVVPLAAVEGINPQKFVLPLIAQAIPLYEKHYLERKAEAEAKASEQTEEEK